MPRPVSLTVTSTCEFTRDSRNCTLPPRGVNLIALDSRFQTICCRRSASPDTGAVSGSITVSTRTPLASAAGMTVAIASRKIPGRSTGSTFRRSRPATIRETSRTSSMICFSDVALRSTTSHAPLAFSGDNVCVRIMRAYPERR